MYPNRRRWGSVRRDVQGRTEPIPLSRVSGPEGPQRGCSLRVGPRAYREGRRIMDSENDGPSAEDLMRLGAEIVSAYVSRNAAPADALPDIIRSVHGALASLTSPQTPEAPPERPKPAVPIARSVQHDYIVCLEDGKRLKMLKRYLRSRYDMDPDEYRRRWGLPPDYPMVAPAYAARRSDFAKKIGLGKGVRRRK